MACKACRQRIEARKLDIAKNLIQTGGNAIKAYVRGEPVWSSTEMILKRVQICKNCPSKKYISETDRCASCGCYIQRSILKTPGKATIASATCPHDHW